MNRTTPYRDKGLFRQSLLDSARRVVAAHGFWRTEIRHLVEASGTGRATIYRYFPNGKDQIFVELARDFTAEAAAQFPVLLANYEDSAERLVAMTRFGFQLIEEYGLMALELVAGLAPPAVHGVFDPQLVYRFIGRTIKDCVAQGHCREGIDVRHAVHTYFTLVHPDYYRRRRDDGASLDQIMDEVLFVFFSAFARERPERLVPPAEG